MDTHDTYTEYHNPHEVSGGQAETKIQYSMYGMYDAPEAEAGQRHTTWHLHYLGFWHPLV